MMYFKVVTGFGPDDYTEIDETEVEKAIIAQVTGRIFLSKHSGSISGSKILEVKEDWNRELGLKRGYKMTGEDYDLINSQRRQEYRKVLELSSTNIKLELDGRPRITELPGSSEAKKLSERFKN